MAQLKIIPNQRGMTLSNLLLVGAVLAFFVLFGMRTVPHYIDDWTLGDIAKSVQSEVNADTTVREIETKIAKRLQLNNIRSFDLDENLEVDQTGDTTNVVLAYSVTEDFIHNIQIVLSFEHVIELE